MRSDPGLVGFGLGVGVLLWAHWVMDLALSGVSRWVLLWVLGHWWIVIGNWVLCNKWWV